MSLNPLDAVETARKLIDVVLSLVPHEVARKELDDSAIRRANAFADAAEAVKFLGNPFGSER